MNQKELEERYSIINRDAATQRQKAQVEMLSAIGELNQAIECENYEYAMFVKDHQEGLTAVMAKKNELLRAGHSGHSLAVQQINEEISLYNTKAMTAKLEHTQKLRELRNKKQQLNIEFRDKCIQIRDNVAKLKEQLKN